MKSTYLFLFIIAALLGICFLGATELLKENKLKQAEIDGLKKEIQEQADSLQKVYNLRGDSLKTALHTIEVKHEETTKATIASERELRKLRLIVFKVHNDSSRTEELKRLYPTFNPKQP